MGGLDSGRIATDLLDGGATGNTLGASAGADAHILTITQIPAHNHTGTTGLDGAHTHDYITATNRASDNACSAASGWNGAGGAETTEAPDHAHTIPSQGGGLKHNNLQPSLLAGWYIKL
jgi:microcystin-dependent protein